MKTRFLFFSPHFLMLPVLMIFLAATAENSRADVSLGVSLYQFSSSSPGQSGYAIYLSLNTTNVPITYDEVYSPSSNSYAGIGNGSSSNAFSIPNFPTLTSQLTNGTWKLILNVGDPSQQIYTFKVSATNFTHSSIFPIIQINTPGNNDTTEPASPIFIFNGPANWQSLNVYLDQGNNYFDSATLPVDATYWTPGKSLNPATDYDFIVLYSTNNVSSLNFTVPVTADSQTLSGWSATTSLNLQADSKFTTANFPAPILITEATSLINGTFQLTFTNSVGSTNEIFASTNVATPFTSWVPLGAATENPAGTFNFTDSTSINFPRRFYRVRSP